MEQSKRGSLIESMLNVGIGSIIALATQLILFPIYGIHISLGTDLWILLWFTIISIIRSYVIRRYFNRRLQAFAERIAK
jgi:hypothetical protein